METIFMCLIMAGAILFGFCVTDLLDRALGRKDRRAGHREKFFH